MNPITTLGKGEYWKEPFCCILWGSGKTVNSVARKQPQHQGVDPVAGFHGLLRVLVSRRRVIGFVRFIEF